MRRLRERKKKEIERKSKNNNRVTTYRHKEKENQLKTDRDNHPKNENDVYKTPQLDIQSYSDCIRSFESQCLDIQHKKCSLCKIISINEEVMKMKGSSETFRCSDCRRTKQINVPSWLPSWYDDQSCQRFDLPDELLDLREGEKLMIQIYSIYVPLQHLRKGNHGVLGHVCCFEQDINYVCYELPRKKVDAIKVIKNFKATDEEIHTHSFVIRRTKVLDALKWLIKYNEIYKSYVTINENNLDWMENKEERELPNINIVQDTGKLQF